MSELSKFSVTPRCKKYSGDGCDESEDSRFRAGRRKASKPENKPNKLDRFAPVTDPGEGACTKGPTSKAASRRRTKYKRQRQKLTVSGEIDLIIDDAWSADESEEERSGDERAAQILPPCGIDGDVPASYIRTPSEHLLSDHTAIDVLLLEAEMKNVLSDLEAFGVADDDYGSLAMTTEEEKVESECWPAFAPSARSSRSGAGCSVDNNDEEAKDDENDDWEVLSDEGSVWTVDTFADARSYRDVLLLESLKSRTFVRDSETRLSEKEGAHPPSDIPERKGGRAQLYVELLENADIWTSIRDTIRSLGGGKQNTLFRR